MFSGSARFAGGKTLFSSSDGSFFFFLRHDIPQLRASVGEARERSASVLFMRGGASKTNEKGG